MTIAIAETIGRNCLTLEQGERVYAAIHPELKKGTAVELDFEGVSIFASPFFNAAVGRLMADIEANDLNRLLRLEHLAPTGLKVLRHVIENSKEYYRNPRMRAALDKIISDQSFEDQSSEK